MRILTTVRLPSFIIALTAIQVLSCGDSGGITADISETLEPVDVEAGGEVSAMCQSWTLNNDEPLYVSKVRQTNEGGWHHSNWFYVPEGTYPGPDGTWRCNDRGFDQATAAVAGGVFFAQSTQALTDLQAFPSGAVLEVPPRSVIVGNIHLLNLQATPLRSAISFDIETVPLKDAKIRLRPVSFTNEALDIPPNAESRFSMTCDLEETFVHKLGEMPDYNVYFVLPHYHEFGNYFRLGFVDAAGNEDVIYEIERGIGDPLGLTMKTALPSRGATGMRVTCGYLNPTDEPIDYGLGGKEMCVFLAYIDADIAIGAVATTNTTVGPDTDGIEINESGCNILVGL